MTDQELIKDILQHATFYWKDTNKKGTCYSAERRYNAPNLYDDNYNGISPYSVDAMGIFWKSIIPPFPSLFRDVILCEYQWHMLNERPLHPRQVMRKHGLRYTTQDFELLLRKSERALLNNIKRLSGCKFDTLFKEVHATY